MKLSAEGGQAKPETLMLWVKPIVVYSILDSNGKDENFSNKSKHYMELYQKALERCRISIDSDGDGVGDITIGGGMFRMKRE